MELNVAEDGASEKKEFRLSRARNQKAMRSNILDTTAQVNGGSVVSQSGEDGVVRMKIVVKRQDLKQMLEVVRGGNKNNIARQSSLVSTPSLSLEQRLNIMRRRHVLRGSQVRGTRRSSWRPALQSIPEELQT